jgi:hypothetical protein
LYHTRGAPDEAESCPPMTLTILYFRHFISAEQMCGIGPFQQAKPFWGRADMV